MSYYATISKSNFYVSTENTGRVLAKFQQLPYHFTLDDAGNIIGIQSNSCPQYSDLPVLQAVAPYVRDRVLSLSMGRNRIPGNGYLKTVPAV